MCVNGLQASLIGSQHLAAWHDHKSIPSELTLHIGDVQGCCSSYALPSIDLQMVGSVSQRGTAHGLQAVVGPTS